MSLSILTGGGRHRAVDRVAELTSKLATANATARKLGQEKSDLYADWRFAEHKAANAEDIVVVQDLTITDLTAERDQLHDEVLALKARLAPYLAAEANRKAVTVPPGVRDTSDGADQATEPLGIDVTTLREAADAGLLGPPATSPAHIPRTTSWARTQEMPVVGRATAA